MRWWLWEAITKAQDVDRNHSAKYEREPAVSRVPLPPEQVAVVIVSIVIRLKRRMIGTPGTVLGLPARDYGYEIV